MISADAIKKHFRRNKNLFDNLAKSFCSKGDLQMAKANTKELLLKAKNISEQIKAGKQAQQKIYSELASQFTPEEKTQQIREATAILHNAKSKRDSAIAKAKEEYKNEKFIASEMLDMVQAKNSSLPKIKNHIAIDSNGIARIKRNGNDTEFIADTKKANWQQILIKDLAKQNIENGVSRNIAYKVSCMIK